MKDLVAKLKSAGYKQLLIDHGEKLVAGIVGLLLLLALFGATWSTYEKTPEELTAKVDSAAQAIAQNKWEDSEAAQSGKIRASAGLKKEQVVQLITRDEQARADLVEQQRLWYSPSAPLVYSLITRQEPASQPDTLPVEELIAGYGRALIPKAAVTTTPQNIAAAENPGDPAAVGGRRKRLRDGFGGNNADGALAGGPGDFAAPDLAAGGGAFDAAGMGPGMLGTGTEADGMRYVSVRGVVPLFRQIEQVAQALNVSHQEASQLVEYWDFELQRRARPLAGGRDWNDWQKVDIRTAKEVLREAASWDPEIIEMALTDPVLTMALPTRVMYNWLQEEASHPKLDNYVLPPRQREQQMEFYERILTQRISQMTYEREQTKRGFSDLQQGNRQYGAGMGPMGMQTRMPDNMLAGMLRNIDPQNAEQKKRELMEQWKENTTAAGRLLLFRYFDFDVSPGTTYQYRVRLVLANPNYNRPSHSVIDPEITREQFLNTPFSQPTAEVTVPEDVKHFVTKVDEARGANPPSATFDVYQWSTDYGTTINEQIKIYFGGFVGERVETEIIDPAQRQILEEREVDLKSEDVLVDIFDAPERIDTELHPDLKDLPFEKLVNGLGVSDQALLVNEAGELVALDPVSMAAAHQETKSLFEREQSDLDGIRQSAASAEDALAGYEDEFGPGGDPAAGERCGRRGRGGNALRRGR